MTPGTPDRAGGSAPVGAGADAHAGGKPDPKLAVAVAAGLYRAAAFDPDVPWPPLFPGEDREYERLASYALAAAGRVLARQLRARAETAQHLGMTDTAMATEQAALDVLRLCGLSEDDGRDER